MSELERVRWEADVHLSRAHLRAAALGVALACVTSFLLGVSVAQRQPAEVLAGPAHVPREDLVELLARVEASDELHDGVEEFTYVDALTQSSGGAVVEAEPAPAGRFRVEVGRFTDVAEARRVRDQLRDAGFPAWVGAQLHAGVMQWRVASGAFETEEEAAAHVTSLGETLGAWPELHPGVVTP